MASPATSTEASASRHGIRLEQLTKRYGDRAVVSNVSLDVGASEFRVLLGPSGSGKSTVLRLIAGLSAPDAGRVLVDGEDLAGVPVQKRGCGFVFQSYALFRRMTVADNVEFALRVRSVPAADRRARREELLELVGLAGLGRRYPEQLSGGQQQRVALARALAHRPRLLLLDEPFGALDARIRVELRRNLQDIQRELGIPTLFVTHDQEEAFELADRIALMANGRLVEEGAPKELYLRPRTEFAAVFLGGANLWSGRTSSRGVRLGALELPLDGTVRVEEGTDSGLAPRPIQVLVRPEDVSVARRREDLEGSPLGEAEVVESSFVGVTERLRLRMPALEGVRALHPPPPFGGASLAIDASRSQPSATHAPLATGDAVWVGVRRLHALPQPGLSIVAAGDGPLVESAREFAQLAQARFESVTDRRALARHAQGSAIDLVVARLAGVDAADDSERWLEESAEAHLLLLPAAVRLPPARILLSVSVGQPGKDDIAFSALLANLLGSRVTLFTVLPEDASQADQRWAERFLDGGKRALEREGVPTETAIARGEWTEALVQRLRDGHDLLVLGAPLPDESGQVRWGRRAGRLLEQLTKLPVLVVRSRLGTVLKRDA
jgi:sulfate transport system ATP-binding protein